MDSADHSEHGKVSPARFCLACLELSALPVSEVVRLFDAEEMPAQEDISRAAETMIKETPTIPQNSEAMFRLLEVVHWAKSRLHDQLIEDQRKSPPQGHNKIAG